MGGQAQLAGGACAAPSRGGGPGSAPSSGVGSRSSPRYFPSHSCGSGVGRFSESLLKRRSELPGTSGSALGGLTPLNTRQKVQAPSARPRKSHAPCIHSSPCPPWAHNSPRLTPRPRAEASAHPAPGLFYSESSSAPAELLAGLPVCGRRASPAAAGRAFPAGRAWREFVQIDRSICSLSFLLFSLFSGPSLARALLAPLLL